MRWLVLLLVGCQFRAGASPADKDAAIVGDVPLADMAISPDASLDAPPGVTPIVYVQGASAQANNTAANVAVGYSGAQTAGNLNIIVISHFTDASVMSIVDLAGNTYSSLNVATSGTLAQDVYYAQNIRTGIPNNNVVTASFSQPTNQPTIRIVEYSGIAIIALDTSVVATGSGSAADSGPSVTTHAHDLIFGAETSSQTVTGPGSMFTQRILFSGDIIEDREVSAVGSYRAIAPINQNASWIMLLASFKGVP